MWEEVWCLGVGEGEALLGISDRLAHDDDKVWDQGVQQIFI